MTSPSRLHVFGSMGALVGAVLVAVLELSGCRTADAPDGSATDTDTSSRRTPIRLGPERARMVGVLRDVQPHPRGLVAELEVTDVLGYGPSTPGIPRGDRILVLFADAVLGGDVDSAEERTRWEGRTVDLTLELLSESGASGRTEIDWRAVVRHE